MRRVRDLRGVRRWRKQEIRNRKTKAWFWSTASVVPMLFLSKVIKYADDVMFWHCGFYCQCFVLPAVCSLWGQDVGEEHLRQLPEVQELIPATAKGDMKVSTILIQSSLLKKLCVLHYRAEREWVCSLWFKDIWLTDIFVFRESIQPFCLALLIISMCFMETLRSFFVIIDATSTWRNTNVLIL